MDIPGSGVATWSTTTRGATQKVVHSPAGVLILTPKGPALSADPQSLPGFPDCDLLCRGHGAAPPPAATYNVAATEGKSIFGRAPRELAPWLPRSPASQHPGCGGCAQPVRAT